MSDILTEKYEEVLSENARLKAVQPVGQKATLFVVSIIILCMLTVVGIVVLMVARPNQDNTAPIATIIGITTPIIAALLAAAVQQVHAAVNSRLSQLLELTDSSAKARGALQEKEKADALEEESVLLKPVDPVVLVKKPQV